MVIPVQRTPRLALKFRLPLVQNALKLGQLVRRIRPLAAQRTFGVVIDAHVVEVEEHLQFARIVARPQLRVLGAGRARFAHGHHIVLRERLTVELFHPRMHHRAVRNHKRDRRRMLLKIGGRVIREAFGLRNNVDGVQPETIHTLIEPPAHHRIQVFAYLRVRPVQIGLFLEENVQVELLRGFVPLPGGAAEFGSPVIRRNRGAILVKPVGVFPNVVVAVRVIL